MTLDYILVAKVALERVERMVRMVAFGLLYFFFVSLHEKAGKTEAFILHYAVLKFLIYFLFACF